MASITVTITVRNNDDSILQGATVTIFDNSGAQVAQSTTNSSGVYAPTISSSDIIPGSWRFVVSKRGFHKAGGYVIFSDSTTGAQNVYLQPDLRG